MPGIIENCEPSSGRAKWKNLPCEPAGCPTPGVCSAAKEIEELRAANEVLRRSVQIEHEAAAQAYAKMGEFRKLLDAMLGGDTKLQVAIGGNPRYVDAFLAKARAAVENKDAR